MRPKKTRFIRCNPGERCFRPKCKNISELDGVAITIDEFEVLRLSHLEGFEQNKIAKQMKIHRSTVSRILTSAHQKITDALVNIKAIKIEGGCCKIIKKHTKKMED